VDSPFLRRTAKLKKTGAAGRKSEKSLAHRLGGTQTLASGAMYGDKGDIRLPDFLVESKSTQKDSLAIQLSWLVKISHEALNSHKHPALAINFTNDHGCSQVSGRWVAIPESLFTHLVEKAHL
jgi:hypothetical protein